MIEHHGLWPAQLRYLISYLQPKVGGNKGFRAINLFVSLYRLYARIRRAHFYQWEATWKRLEEGRKSR